MDNSNTYAKMCDCEEIQDLLPKLGQAYNKKNFWASFIDTEDVSKSRSIFLPRQDQIQDMMRKYYAKDINDDRPLDKWFPEGNIGLTYVLKEFCKFADENSDLSHKVKSFEELWLKFYMWEKYKYFWSHEERWIRADK